MTDLKRSARSVQDALEAAGVNCRVVQLPDSARTAKDAAAAIGCGVDQIAKSIVFRAATTGRAVLVIASGANRIDEARVAAHLGEAIERATPAFVRDATGYAIGGVPPCAHAGPLEVFVDRDLLELPEVWAAAGTPDTVFRIVPHQLLALTGGTVIEVA